MGKLHVYEETGETRVSRANEAWLRDDGTLGAGYSVLPHDILRRLSDAEAAALTCDPVERAHLEAVREYVTRGGSHEVHQTIEELKEHYRAQAERERKARGEWRVFQSLQNRWNVERGQSEWDSSYSDAVRAGARAAELNAGGTR